MENGSSENVSILRISKPWPSRPPKELAIRLDEVLHNQCPEVDDLWNEFGEWLTNNKVAPPKVDSSLSLSSEIDSIGSNRTKHIPQSGSGMQLTRLVYSSIHSGLSFEDFDEILQKSRSNNARDLVTGALIISENNFMQLLEGSRGAIGQCLIRIVQDKRHQDFQIVSCGDVQNRLFQEWSMHLIMASKVKKEILSMYLINGVFSPNLMSEFAIEDLCRTLSEGNWDSQAA